MRARDQQVQARALDLLGRTARARWAAPGAAGGEPDPPAGRPPVVELPEGLRGAVVRPSWPAVVGLALVLVLVAAVFSVRVVAARTATAPVPVAPAAGAGGGGATGARTRTALPSSSAATSTAQTPLAGPAPTPAALVVVDVVGAVRRPGVQRLPAGARVVDAVAAAGGSTPDADLAGVNRARPLVDGEQLRVPRAGEPASTAAGAPGGPAPGVPAGAPAGVAPPAPGAAGPASVVDLNTADAAVLDTLPGVGPAIAGRILEWRTAHGRFTSVDELGEVSGIGDRLLERLRPLVRV